MDLRCISCTGNGSWRSSGHRNLTFSFFQRFHISVSSNVFYFTFTSTHIVKRFRHVAGGFFIYIYIFYSVCVRFRLKGPLKEGFRITIPNLSQGALLSLQHLTPSVLRPSNPTREKLPVITKKCPSYTGKREETSGGTIVCPTSLSIIQHGQVHNGSPRNWPPSSATSSNLLHMVSALCESPILQHAVVDDLNVLLIWIWMYQ